jgi:hypothetical protein
VQVRSFMEGTDLVMIPVTTLQRWGAQVLSRSQVTPGLSIIQYGYSRYVKVYIHTYYGTARHDAKSAGHLTGFWAGDPST